MSLESRGWTRQFIGHGGASSEAHQSLYTPGGVPPVGGYSLTPEQKANEYGDFKIRLHSEYVYLWISRLLIPITIVLLAVGITLRLYGTYIKI